MSNAAKLHLLQLIAIAIASVPSQGIELSAMKNLLEDLYSDVLTAPTIEAFKVELIKFGKKLGFDLVIADYASPPPKRAWTSIHNYPSMWWEQQFQFLPIDPAMICMNFSRSW